MRRRNARRIVEGRFLLKRMNELERVDEPWRPPAFVSTSSRRGKVTAFCRRLLDLQAASIWRDLRKCCAEVGGVVLDVGAGAQPYRDLFPAGTVYRAIDTEHAGVNFDYRTPGTVYFEGDVWPVSSGTVDVIMATETLEHVVDPDRFIEEARRVLRIGGGLLLTVPFSARWHYVPHDYWRFTPSGLRILLERHGFTDIRIHARGNAVTVAMSKCSALILPLLVSPRGSWRVPRVALGLILSPFLIVFSAIGQASLRVRGGSDCLGYTVLAGRTSD